jgi:hypothetical protein
MSRVPHARNSSIGSLRKEDRGFQSRLGYTMRPCLKKKAIKF